MWINLWPDYMAALMLLAPHCPFPGRFAGGTASPTLQFRGPLRPLRLPRNSASDCASIFDTVVGQVDVSERYTTPLRQHKVLRSRGSASVMKHGWRSTTLAPSDPKLLDFTSKACNPCHGLSTARLCPPRIEERLHHKRIAACDERQDGFLDVFVTPQFHLLLVERQLLDEPKQRILTVAVRTSEATPSLQK